MSLMRKKYFLKLGGRCVILLLCVIMYVFKPEYLSVLNGAAFFDKPSPLHILWIIWMLGMLYQLIPIKRTAPLGSQKNFGKSFKPVRNKINYKVLKKYATYSARSAYIVFALWCVLIGAAGILYYHSIVKGADLFIIAAAFYVCDLICVLIWCPFRLIMKNRCCTTCRIFNWDHLMMFSPMVFINGFFSRSLVFMAAVVWAAWELTVILHPERFWEGTNAALRCAACTDKLCTQYCKDKYSDK